MGIKKCSNGHFFDDEKYDFCPYCDEKNNNSNGDQRKEKKSPFSLFEKTVAKFKSDTLDSVTVAYSQVSQEEKDDQLTVAKYMIDDVGAPVSGWLVCIEGREKGKSFEIRQGVNYVGRNSDMDIAFINEHSITRNKHFSLVFEPKKAETFIKPEMGTVYLNEQFVEGAEKIKENDIISAGDMKFIFVPYCNGERKW
jgi:hypothetical protein